MRTTTEVIEVTTDRVATKRQWTITDAMMRMVEALDTPFRVVEMITATEVRIGHLKSPDTLRLIGEPAAMALLVDVARHAVWLRDGANTISRLASLQGEGKQPDLYAEPHEVNSSLHRYLASSGCAGLTYALGLTDPEDIAFQDVWMFRKRTETYALLEMMLQAKRAGEDPLKIYEECKDLAA